MLDTVLAQASAPSWAAAWMAPAALLGLVAMLGGAAVWAFRSGGQWRGVKAETDALRAEIAALREQKQDRADAADERAKAGERLAAFRDELNCRIGDVERQTSAEIAALRAKLERVLERVGGVDGKVDQLLTMVGVLFEREGLTPPHGRRPLGRQRTQPNPGDESDGG